MRRPRRRLLSAVALGTSQWDRYNTVGSPLPAQRVRNVYVRFCVLSWVGDAVGGRSRPVIRNPIYITCCALTAVAERNVMLVGSANYRTGDWLRMSALGQKRTIALAMSALAQ